LLPTVQDGIANTKVGIYDYYLFADGGISRRSESGSSWFCCLSGRFFGMVLPARAGVIPSRPMLLAKHQNFDSVPGRPI
jgi:hypothetical protein